MNKLSEANEKIKSLEKQLIESDNEQFRKKIQEMKKNEPNKYKMLD